MFRILIGISTLLLCAHLSAQDFLSRQYRVANGLPSDVIKAVAQDTLGYFWIATDDGLVKFDGLKFTAYRQALHSQYSKGFLLTRNGRLLHFGDLDLIEIQNLSDTVIFRSIRLGTRNPTDSMLYYPKSIFEDRHGNIWMGEPQSVVKISNRDMIRYPFSMSDRSPQFLRSFLFFEDIEGSLYTISYFGNVYKFNTATNVFESYPIKLPSDMSAAIVHEGFLYITAFDGLYKAKLLAIGGIEPPQKIFHILNTTNVCLLGTNQFVITSAGDAPVIFSEKEKQIQTLPTKITNANMTYVSREGDLWLASTEGLNLLQRNAFKKAGGEDTFIESIAEDKDGVVYFCTMRYLYKMTTRKKVSDPEVILSMPRGYFQSLVVNEQGLWVANAFSVYLIRNNAVVRQWNLENNGRFIHDLFEDSQHNIWLSQGGNNNAVRISPDFSTKHYPISLAPESSLNAVREGPDGMYVLANGVTSNLFFKAKNEENFKNISRPVKFAHQGDFNVTDVAFNKGSIWFASTEGLLQLKDEELTRVDLGEQFTKLSVKNVKSLQEGQLLFANSFGLFRYDIASGDYWLYDESNGLASNTIPTRGLYVDPKGHVWVGTSKGLSYSLEAITNSKKTLKPNIVEVSINGTASRFTNRLRAPYSSFIGIRISSITFPETNITYQYRESQRDTTWHSIQQNQLLLTGLTPGVHTYQIRARKNGGFSWSDTTTATIQIDKPFWQEPYFLSGVIVAIGLVAWISFGIATTVNKRRRAYLEHVISQRTQELKLINEELSTRNNELDRFVYSASHDLSAPLKSLLGLVYIARKDDINGTMQRYLDMMELSIKKLEDFIRDVTNYSRNARMEVILNEINLEAIVQSVLRDHQYTQGFEEILFHVDVASVKPFVSDETRLKIILNNLISNAIKFRWAEPGRKSEVKICAEEKEDSIEIIVTDNGRGIEQDKVEKVFNMFYRGTDSIPGSGLGLYILKEAVAKLNGSVMLKSELGKGATFTIIIPKK